MKQLYRVLPIVLIIGLIGCSNSSTPETTAADNAVKTENRDNFVSALPDTAPTLKVAMTGNLPPFSFQDNYGNMQGTDVDSIRAIGEEQGFKVEFYKETWQGLFDSVDSGARDLAVSGIAYTEDRATNYGLSTPYFFNPSSIMYADDDLNIQSLDDLSGLRVGVLKGSRQASFLQSLDNDIELLMNTTSFLSYESLIQGEIDAIVDDMHISQYTAKNHPEYKVTIIPYEDQSTPSAQQVVLMAKDNIELIESINEGIKKLQAKGKFKEIEELWLSDTEVSTQSTAVTTSNDLSINN